MKKGIIRLITIVFVVFILYNCIGLLRPSVKTQMAHMGTMEKSFALEGIIARDETVIRSDESGVLESKVKENELVKRNKVVATVYKGDIDEESQKKLTEINRRIGELTAQSAADSHSNDAYKVESGISSKVSDIIIASNQRDAEKVSTLKENLKVLSDKKTAADSSAATATSILAELRSQKEYYETKFNSSKTDIMSPTPGLYSTNIDGFEEYVSNSSVSGISVADLQAIKKKKFTKDDILNSGVICKITDNYQWSIAAIVSDGVASELENGKSVFVRFGDGGDDISATVSYISQASGGKYVVVLTSTQSSDYAMSNRQVDFDLICSKYTGLKIPANAISVDNDGKTGVFVLTEGEQKFKEVNVLYKDGKNAIAETGTGKDNYLLLYDEVITYSKE